MQTPRDRTLKVIKGAKAGVPGRPRQRRIVSRQLPRTEPIGDLLERLDQEAVEDPTGSAPDEPADQPARGGPRRRDRQPVDQPARGGPRRRERMLVGLLAVVLGVTLAAAAVFGQRWYTARAVDEARQEAVAAAKQASVNFVSVSAASVDRDLQRISAGATGDFKEEFTRGQSQVRAAVVENKVESHGSVLRAGLVSGDRGRAVVLVAVDATVKNAKAPEGRPSHYRIQLDMVHDRESGKWLVSRLQFVG